MRLDARASFRLWEIDLRLGGRRFTIPAMPAADWLDLLIDADPLQILMACDDPSIADVDVTDQELREACLDAIGEVSGRHGLVAVALVQTAVERWDIVGPDLAVLDLETVPLGRALDLVLRSLLSHVKDEQAANQLITYLEGLETGADSSGLVLPGLGKRPEPSPVPANAEQYVASRPKTRRRPSAEAAQSTKPTRRSSTPVGSGRLAKNAGLSSGPPTSA